MNTICYDEQTRRSMKREATARRYGLKVEAADSCRSLLRLEPFAIQFAKYFNFDHPPGSAKIQIIPKTPAFLFVKVW